MMLKDTPTNDLLDELRRREQEELYKTRARNHLERHDSAPKELETKDWSEVESFAREEWKELVRDGGGGMPDECELTMLVMRAVYGPEFETWLDKIRHES